MSPSRIFLIVAVLTLASRDAQAVPLYSVVDLGPANTLGRTFPTDLNNRGDVVVSSGIYHSYGPDAGKVTNAGDVQVGANLSPYIRRINDPGEVAGSSRYGSGWDYQPFVTVAGKSTPITGVTGFVSVVPNAVNNAGDVLLQGDGGSSFLYRNGQLVNFGSLNGSNSTWAGALNDQGQAAGYSYTGPGSGNYHAVILSGSQVIDVGTLGGATSKGLGINNRGDMVGSSTLAGGGTNAHAFLYSDGKMTDLGTLGGNAGDSGANSINNNGLTVGESNGKAVLWKSGSIYDLNTLLKTPIPEYLVSALKINDLGQIIALGYGYTDGQARGFLLTPEDLAVPGTGSGPVPVPEPGAFLVFGCLAVGLTLRRRRAA